MNKPGLCDSLQTELGGGLGHLPSGHLSGSAVQQGASWRRRPAGLSTFSLAQAALMAFCSAGSAPACLLQALKLGVVVPPTHPAGVTAQFCFSCVSTKVQSGVLLRPPAVLRLSTGSEQRLGASMPKEPEVPHSPEQQLCGPWEALLISGGCSVWKAARWQRQPGVLPV